MDGYLMAIGSAVWLGILTSISPCPLATNIAAITYIGKRVGRPGVVLLSGMAYTVGRTLAYLAVSMLVVASILSIPGVAMFLQGNMNRFLGPILVVVGLILLDVFRFRFPGRGVSDNLQKRIDKWGVWGAALLGFLFALSFCPVSAGLFFGSLIPLALDYQSTVVMPAAFGLGTALPVVVFALFIALGARFVGALFDQLTVFEKWARRITAVAFIGVGLYYSAVYIMGW